VFNFFHLNWLFDPVHKTHGSCLLDFGPVGGKGGAMRRSRAACLLSVPSVLVWLFVFSIDAFTSSAIPAGGTGELGAPVPDDIIINELMVDPQAVNDTDGEYIELYNNSENDVDLEGWVIADNGVDYHVIDNGGPLVVSPGEYVVLARNADPGENGGFIADYEYTGFVLSNLADEVVLSDPQGITVDSLEYSRDLGFPLETGSSIELRNQLWMNSMGAAWHEAILDFGDGDFGTPGSVNSTHEEFSWVEVDASVVDETVTPGDSLIVRIVIFNPSWLDWTCDVASFLRMPNGSPFCGNPVDGPVTLLMSEGRCIGVRRAYYVPAFAPLGVYQLSYGAREHGGDALDCERVEFEVIAPRTD
jgi:hypothetical protein